MADDKNRELKPTSIRVDDETGKKLKELVKGFPNQNEALRKLIETYELQQSKAVIRDKQAFITQFEEYSSCMVKMYIQSIEDNQNLRGMVQEEFNTLIQSKDKIIQDLQGQLEDAKQQADAALQQVKALTDEKSVINEKLQENIAKINGLKSSLSDKDELNKVLSEKCNSLGQQVRNMEKNHNTLAEMKAERTEYEKTLFETECRYQNEINKLKKENQKEIDRYQNKYFKLLEKIQFHEKQENI